MKALKHNRPLGSIFRQNNRHWRYFTAVPLVLVLLSAVTLTLSYRTFAASQTKQQGITVAPATLRFNLSTDKPQQNAAVSIKNNFSAPVTMAVELKGIDLNKVQPAPFGKPEAGVSQAVAFSPGQVSLQPDQSVNIELTVSDNVLLSPGGHYATLVIRQTASGQTIGVLPAISVSLFIVKLDGAVERINAKPPAVPLAGIRLPESVHITFENEGNVDTVPRAAVTVQNANGGTVFAKGAANPTSIPVFPGKTLTLEVPLAEIAHPRWPGRYGVFVRYRPDGAPLEQAVKSVFWYIPVWFISVIVGFVLLGILVGKYRKQLKKRFKIPDYKHRKSERTTDS